MIRRAINRRCQGQSPRRVSLGWESLECRQLMSADAGSAMSAVLAHTASMIEVKTGLIARQVPAPSARVNQVGPVSAQASIHPSAGAGVSGPYNPAQIHQAYGISQLPYDGAGQTIAIIDAYDSPTIASDLAAFDARFNLPAANLVKATPGGSTPAYNSGWALEIALDVEWAHAIAPGAKILLVEAATATSTDLFAAVNYAVAQGANEVSMSFGGAEYDTSSSIDSNFTAPGVSFFAAAGDSGAQAEFPAVSPYVTGVGGTTVSLDSAGNKLSETAWTNSGGGTSAFTARPSYQTGFQSSGNRGVPDVSYNADPNSGIYVVDNGSYYAVGGTSAGAPQWAGLAALVNQGRAANGSSPIGTGLAFGLNSALYSLAGGSSYTNPNGDFADITSGSNGNPATPGYDTATGLGSPVANKLVPDLIAFATTSSAPVAPVAPATLIDSGFEAVSAGSGTSAYVYDPTGSAWSYSGTSGLTGNGTAFTSGNPSAPQGQQVAFIQNLGTISQAVANWSAGNYHINLQAAQRANFGASNQTFQVLVDGASVGWVNPSSTSYQSFSSSSFAVPAGSHMISFAGTASTGDNSAFLDSIALVKDVTPATPAVADSGFENLSASSGTSAYVYDPTGSAWSYSGTSGISGNNSGFTSGNPWAPQGQQVAFIQNLGTISQAVANWSAGNYHINLQAAQRANFGASNQTFQVLVDGNVVATYNPQKPTYDYFTTSTFAVSAGSHTISFKGMASAGDNSVFLDNISITSA